VFGAIYIVLGLYFLFRQRRALPELAHDGFRAPYSELAE
jgi:hypothetical protein